jgi:hypothetical protein
MELFFSLLIGIGLSATSGFRLFLPFLVLSAASLSGHLALSPSFEWLGTYPALAVFAVAALFEILAYFFPFVDNLLSTISIPFAMIAGTVITASLLMDMGPLLTWSLAIIAGGGASLTTKTASTLLHTGSTAVSGGTANPVVSAVETVYSVVMAIVSIVAPVLIFIFFGLIIWVSVRVLKRRKGVFR